MKDSEIVKLFLDRDESAPAEAEKQYGGYCLYIARNVLRDVRDAEECLNDALLAAWESIPPQQPDNLKLYLAKLVHEAALDRRRRNNAQKRRPDSLASFDEIEELVADCGAETAIGELELSQLISDFLRSRAETERNVFIRRYWYYDSVGAICRRYGFGRSKVKMMLKRTRDSLAEYLRKEGQYEF